MEIIYEVFAVSVIREGFGKLAAIPLRVIRSTGFPLPLRIPSQVRSFGSRRSFSPE
jgi:hypothetical protein